MKYLIGTDIGTSGTKTVVTDLAGHVLGQDTRSYPLYQPQAGWAEQSAEDWENAVFDSISASVRKAGVAPGQVAAICVSGLFAGSGIPVDDELRPLRRPIIWMDRRATRQADQVEAAIGTQALFDLTGNRNDAYFGYAKMLWIRDNEPEIWSRARLFLPSNSYIVYRLTGQLTADVTSAANIGGVYDLANHCWGADMLDRLGIGVSRMPSRLCAPEEIAGSLTTAAAERLGLKPGVPVCAGCTDCLASNLAAGVVEEGRQSAIIGTSVNWSVLHRTKPSAQTLVSMPNVIDPMHMLYTYGGVSTAGALTKWFLENLAPYTQACGTVENTAYPMLEAEAAAVAPGCDGLMALPYFMGERSPLWDSEARGVFCGLSLSHTRAHLYRAILESTAFAARHIRESSSLFTNAEDGCVVSGGATRSRLWMQILADVTGVRIRPTSGAVEAPVGDALIAGVAVGLIPSYSAAVDWCGYEPEIQPVRRAYEHYSRLFEQYKRLYRDTRGCVGALSALANQQQEE